MVRPAGLPESFRGALVPISIGKLIPLGAAKIDESSLLDKNTRAYLRRMIENIIFDFGVVLLDVHYEKTIEAFGQLGLDNPAEAFSKHRQDEFFKNFERGLVSNEEFYSELKMRIPGATEEGISRAWNAMLGELPKEKMEVLRELKEKYQMYVLSNTNRIHQEWFESKIEEQYGWDEFKSIFNFIGYSHQIGERKPDKKAFEFLLDKFQLDPERTLFIDDTLEHVKGAQNCGIQTIHFPDGANLREVLSGQIQF